MEAVDVIKQICYLLLNDKKEEAFELAETQMPFDGEYIVENITKENIKLVQQNPACEQDNNPEIKTDSLAGKNYQKHINTIFLRDGFIDRYTGKRLIFPGILFLLHFEFPEIFRYDKNWNPQLGHKIFWELYPTIDHIIAQANDGSHDMHNLITTLQVINTFKNKKCIERKWEKKPAGNLRDWDGLTSIFFELMKKNNDYVDYKHIENWKTRYSSLKKWKNDMGKAIENGNYLLLHNAQK